MHPSNPRSCLVALLPALALLEGCYYWQAVRGQAEIWHKREPIADVIADPATAPELARRLELLSAARDFATAELGLPDNGSYRAYADLGRDYVLWNVIAAPEFSLDPRSWCYPFVGCLAYRGYFAEDAANRLAAKLRDEGYDVYVGGVAAYSTLGRFEDPVLNTMLARDDAELVALLFHELAHQHLYIRDDTGFNESFATAVAELGMARWFAAREEPAAAARWAAAQQATAARLAALAATRERLADLYAASLSPADMRRRKRAILAALAERLGAANNGEDTALNNAWLASVAIYRETVPAFRRLFADCDDDWPCFYSAVEALAARPAAERAAQLTELAAQATR